MDAMHPDFVGDLVDGCGGENGASAGCPFAWDVDALGHGTHVAGAVPCPLRRLGWF